jgi:micrococcal nuclease
VNQKTAAEGELKHLWIFSLFLALTLISGHQVLAGSIYVRDADTIVVDGTPVRLNGVDDPELGSRSGQNAKRWMVNFLRGKSVRCDLNGERTYDRWVGVCFANGQDIAAAVIAAGHALDCARYSGGRYGHLETPAAKSRLIRAGYCR